MGFSGNSELFQRGAAAFSAGRGFIDGEDDVPGAPPKIVLTHALWVRRFAADAGIVGRTIQVNTHAMTVVGVTASGFRGTEVGLAPEFFLPFSQVSELDGLKKNDGRLTRYDSQWLAGLGRLRPDADIRRARAELEVVADGIRDRVPGLARDRGFYMERAGQLTAGLRRIAIPAFLLLLTVTFFVLLTACANVANLLLGRASARKQEIATRLALGAERGRLVRQLLTESLLLALTGGLAGVLLAGWAGRHIGTFKLPLPIPIDLTMSLDYRVVLFSAALSILTGMVFGLVPALRIIRPDLIGSIRSDGGNIASLRRFGLRNALVAAQVAISTVLVICSGLFLRSLGAVRRVDSGMNTSNLMLVRFDPSLSGYGEEETQRLLLNVLRETEAVPGVRSVSMTNLMPLSIGGNFTSVGAEGSTAGDRAIHTALMAVGPSYFETMGISKIAGADFRSVPAGEATAIVNQELARRLYPNRNALGRPLLQGGHQVRIVGVVANTKYQMLQESEVAPILYRPILDIYASEGSPMGLTLIVRAAGSPASLGSVLRQRLRALDPELVVNVDGTMDSHVQESMFLPRLAASLFGLCGAMGLLIASIGVCGVVSFAVARRTREIGIRMALGAKASQVLRMVLWHGMALALAGIIFGVAGSLALTRAARSLIYGISATDPVTFIGVPLILLTVALLATAIPARRAARVDPNRILRAE